MIIQVKENLIKLFENWAKEKALSFSPLPPSGSSRKYYRIKSKNKTALGVFYPCKKENVAFLRFTEHFLKKGLPVPQVYLEDLKKRIYLVQDLGDETLFSFLIKEKEKNGFSRKVVDFYKKTINRLVNFQLSAGVGLNYRFCYPRPKFDRQSMLWDLNYFKYYFLKLAKIPFDEQLLERSFSSFINYLLKADCHYFLYRDCQSRNVMLYKNEPYFIDYQGGRRGALHYDLASLLFDAKADIPQEVRNELLDYYLGVLEKRKKIKRDNFIKYFYAYALIRILQAFGSYGYRGFYEKKEHFLQSIPYALKNLEYVLTRVDLPAGTKNLVLTLKKVIKSPSLKIFEKPQNNRLTITINSFSFKKGLPYDRSGNGGGFVFDCRGLNNPGRLEKYKNLNAEHRSVIKFFEKQKDIEIFLKNVYDLVDQTVGNYLKRNFTDLMVSFGCTGGQHRSMYCANKLAEHLKKNNKIKIIVNHLEQE